MSEFWLGPWKLLAVPARFASGKYWRSWRDTGESIDGGMMLPGNGCPVAGLRIGVLISEKLPCRMRAVGTDAIGLVIAWPRTPS